VQQQQQHQQQQWQWQQWQQQREEREERDERERKLSASVAGESWFLDAQALHGGSALELSVVSLADGAGGASPLHTSMPAVLGTPVALGAALPSPSAPRSAPWQVAPRMLRQQEYWMRQLDRARRGGAPVRVAVTSGRSGRAQLGELRFVGPVAANRAVPLWLGVALDEPRGRHDGAVGAKRYFRCATDHGLFAQPAAVHLESAHEARALAVSEL
jgi:hypothetical protein